MTPADQDLDNRSPVWRALSQLFLDTELLRDDHARIASVLGKSPYSLSEIEQILSQEVYPVCIPNLHSVAGEWAGFDDKSLEDAILKYARRKWTLGRVLQSSRWMIRDDWDRVKALLVQ